MNIKKMTGAIQSDPELMSREKIVVCLDRGYDSMLAGAFLWTAGDGLREIFYETTSDGDRADEAVVRMSEDGIDLVAFHETRPSSRDRRPNGIRVHHEDLNFPCAVFYNSGEEPLTVDGEWLAPGEYTTIQELDPDSPELQSFWAEYLKSPEVLKGVEEARRRHAEVEEARRQAREKGGQA